MEPNRSPCQLLLQSVCCQTSLCKEERSRAEFGKNCTVTRGDGRGLIDPVPHNGEQLTFPWDFAAKGKAASLLPGYSAACTDGGTVLGLLP